MVLASDCVPFGGAVAVSRFPLLEPAQAPWIRPGAVIHEPNAQVDDLLARFAATIRERGFQVAFDDGGVTAGRSMRAAMRDDADLVVIGRFAAFEQAAREMTATVAEGPSRGMPVLTAVGGHCVGQWLNFAGPGGAMLPPDMASLWRWWGPERLYQDLALGVAEAETRRIACGQRWLMVEGPEGAGLAYLPAGGKEVAARIPSYRHLDLRQLAELSRSWDALEMALGIAAINAHYNRFDLDAEIGNGAQTFSTVRGRVVVIGAFPGLAEVLPDPQVIEASPRPGEYPTVAMDTLLPGCAAAVVTSSTLVTRTLPRVLRLAQGARVALVGAATPLTPRLFSYGLEVAGGLIVDDPAGLAAAVEAGAQPRDFMRFGRYVHLKDGGRPAAG